MCKQARPRDWDHHPTWGGETVSQGHFDGVIDMLSVINSYFVRSLKLTLSWL